MSDKVYLGNGKELFGGDMVSFSLDLKKLRTQKEKFFDFDDNGNVLKYPEGDRYIKLKVCRKQGGVDQYGKTHYILVDDFEPTQKPLAPQTVKKDEDIPF
tara:strand:+ start:450 stop:749 length:300 start_codon:yes stop_codon:yes gene_type:complete